MGSKRSNGPETLHYGSTLPSLTNLSFPPNTITLSLSAFTLRHPSFEYFNKASYHYSQILFQLLLTLFFISFRRVKYNINTLINLYILELAHSLLELVQSNSTRALYHTSFSKPSILLYFHIPRFPFIIISAKVSDSKSPFLKTSTHFSFYNPIYPPSFHVPKSFTVFPFLYMHDLPPIPH